MTNDVKFWQKKATQKTLSGVLFNQLFWY